VESTLWVKKVYGNQPSTPRGGEKGGEKGFWGEISSKSLKDDTKKTPRVMHTNRGGEGGMCQEGGSTKKNARTMKTMHTEARS